MSVSGIRGSRRAFRMGWVAGAAAMLAVSQGALAQTLKDSYSEFEAREFLSSDPASDLNGTSAPVRNASGPFVFGFEGPSQYNAASFGRNFIPPDTMGAVGLTQYVSTTNGAYGVFDKATGANLSMVADTTFWANAGQTGANGDSRILYNATANRWIAVSFASSVSQLQIAVSNSSDALGGWQSVKFTGFAGGTADYPTLAMDNNAVYIGTNNFKVGCNPGNTSANAYCGTSLNVIPLNSLFSAGAPSVTNMKTFVTPYTYGTGNDQDFGFAIQGVNSKSTGSTGKVVANSAFYADNLGYQVNGLTPDSATAATLSPITYMNVNTLADAGPARQPATITANQRVIDALDQRISSSVFEAQGKIFTVQTVDGGSDYARVRYTVVDANTFAVLDQGDLGTGSFDYFQGSIAVNDQGRVVIAYDRSGLQTSDLNNDGLPDGNVSFMAQTFWVDSAGKLHATSDEMLLKVSLTNDYHNGGLDGQPASGRQRWGDYSQVTIDPTDPNTFWAIGEFAREYNDAANGHPGGTGGSRWGTYIAEIAAPVPEPGTVAMMLAGLGIVGAAARSTRRRS